MQKAIAILMSLAMLAGCAAPLAPQLNLRQETSSHIFSTNGKVWIALKHKTGARITRSAIRTIPALNLAVLAVDPQKVDATLKQLAQDKDVVYAHPSCTVKALMAPNDPMFAQQHGPKLTQAPEAWNISRGKGVTIAIVDTGVDTEHPDLKNKMVAGYNVLDRSSNPRDDNGHGTHCAGVAGAETNNATGIAGMAPDAKIMPIKALNSGGGGSDALVAEGVVWAVDHGAQIVSLSLGTPEESAPLKDACAYAAVKGVLVVAAMGNAGNGDKNYPAAYPGVLAVGATDEQDKEADFSQYGEWISVCAPGTGIYSTFPTYNVTLNDDGYPTEYAALDGTSMATPMVAGVAALVKAKYPSYRPEQIKQRIEATADRASAFNIHTGNGRINALKSLNP